MKIISVEARVIKVDRDLNKHSGTAGTPGTFVEMTGSTPSDYGWTKEYSTLYSKKVESLLVKIETDIGIVGWGESQVPVGPEAPQTLVKHVLTPILINQDPLQSEVLWYKMYNSLRGRGHRSSFMMDAIAAIDIALWDIAGKYYKQPIHQLLGGAFHENIPLYHSGVAGVSIEEKVISALEIVKKGYKAIKIYIGKGIKQDIEVIREIRNAVGDDITLLADSLWMYNVHEAIKLGSELEKLGVTLLEAPTVMEDLQGHIKMTNSLQIAIAQGETERTRYQFLPYLKERALDVIQPDIGRTGITEGKKIITLAETFNIPTALHMAIGQCVYIAASIHLAVSTPKLLWLELNPNALEMANNFLKKPLIVEDGMLQAPQSPGLGIEIDEAVFEKYNTE